MPGRDKGNGREVSTLGNLPDGLAFLSAEGCVGENIKLKAEPVFMGLCFKHKRDWRSEAWTESVQKSLSYVRLSAQTV